MPRPPETPPAGGSAHARPGRAGFTLIESLVVIAIIAILASITVGVVKGVNERAAIARAKAEVAVLATALEGYKRQYGDYPRTEEATITASDTLLATGDGPGILFNALVGKRGPTGAAMNGRSLVEAGRFTLGSSTALPEAGSTDAVANAFLDPWGRRYLYFYRVGTEWQSPGYVLLSVGPDGQLVIPTSPGDRAHLTGRVTDGFRAATAGRHTNADNLIANH